MQYTFQTSICHWIIILKIHDVKRQMEVSTHYPVPGVTKGNIWYFSWQWNSVRAFSILPSFCLVMLQVKQLCCTDQQCDTWVFFVVNAIGHFEGFVQNCSNSIANTLELLQSCSHQLHDMVYWPLKFDVMPFLLTINSTHIFQGCFTSTGEIIGNYQSKPDQLGLINHRNALRTDNITTTNWNTTKPGAYFTGHIVLFDVFMPAGFPSLFLWCLHAIWVSILISVIQNDSMGVSHVRSI